ncbi:tape measure protein [Motilimonas sp. 1_MG-2023]|uniref:tape measure protein n=1 Tax=Motilimonas sp. 1_MG-2023 TaxID=3062672 RepID=UPI0026E42574|nr:tape measure protein [Motilimonas sp. 1_MG-2023]MDO6526941.1 tape measure protein [Motilimonas sp. 1_MG-2023]
MSKLSLSLNIDTKTTGSESLKKLSALLDELGAEAAQAHPEANMLGQRINELERQQAAVEQFRKLKTELNTTSTELKQAEQRTRALAKEINQADKPTKALTASFNRAKAESRGLKAAQSEQQQTLQQLRNQLSNAGINSKNLNTEQQKLATSMRAAEQWAQSLTQELGQQQVKLKQTASATGALNQKSQQASQGFHQASQAGTGFNGRLNAITTSLIAAGAAYVGINTLTSSVLDLLNTGGKFEALDAQMKALMGSIEAGEQATEWVKQFAKNTPFQLDGVTKAFIKLKAYGLDPMDGTMQALTDQVAQMGGDQEKLEGVVLAVGQAWSKQKLQAEEVNQLVERGIPVWQLLEKVTGKTTQEIQKMSEQGKIGRKEIKLLVDEMGKASAGSAAAMMSTWNGMVSNLQDNLDKVKNTIANAGLLDTFKDELNAINTAIDEMAADGSLQQYAKEISDAITSTLSALKTGLATIWEWREAIGNLAQLVIGLKLASMFAGFPAAAASAATALIGFKNQMLLTQSAANGMAAAGSAGMNTLAAGAMRFTSLLGPLAAGSILAAQGIDYITRAAIGYDVAIAAAAESQKRMNESQGQLDQQLTELSSKLGIQIKSMEQLERLVASGAVKWNEQSQSYYNVAKAIAEKNAAAELAWAQDTKNHTLMDKMVLSQQALTDTIKGLNTAALDNTLPNWVTTTVAAFDPSKIEQVANFGTVLEKATAHSAALAQSLETELAAKLAKLSGEDLAAFSANLQQLFDNGMIGADEFANGIDAALNASFTKLGLDMAEVNNQITATGKSAIDAFALISSSGTQSFDAVKTAFDASIGQAKTQTELDALKAIWLKYAQDNNLATDQITAGVKRIEDAQNNLIRNTSEVEKAFQQLGIQSAKTLADIAQKNKDAYFIIKESGVASATDVANALSVWVDSAIKATQATGGQIDPLIDVEKAANGLTDQFKNLTTAQDNAATSSRNLASDLASTATAAADAATQVENATRRIIDANARTRQSEIDKNTASAGSTLGSGVDTSNLGGKSVRELEAMMAELARNMTKTGLSRGFNNGTAIDALIKQMQAQMDELREALRKRKEEEKSSRANANNRSTAFQNNSQSPSRQADKVIRLEIGLPSGKALQAQTSDLSLLAELERLKGVSF